MWTCPRCGREFTRTNQGHYCGKTPETVDEYIELQPEEARAHVTELRHIIQQCVPEIRERIAWSMPRYEKDGRSISFAACKKHVSFYIDAEILDALRPQLSGLVIRKNAIYLSYDQALPIGAIENAVRRSFDAK